MIEFNTTEAQLNAISQRLNENDVLLIERNDIDFGQAGLDTKPYISAVLKSTDGKKMCSSAKNLDMALFTLSNRVRNGRNQFPSLSFPQSSLDDSILKNHYTVRISHALKDSDDLTFELIDNQSYIQATLFTKDLKAGLETLDSFIECSQ